MGQIARKHQRGILSISGGTARAHYRNTRSFETLFPLAFHVQRDRWVEDLPQQRRINTIIENQDLGAEKLDVLAFEFSKFEQVLCDDAVYRFRQESQLFEFCSCSPKHRLCRTETFE